MFAKVFTTAAAISTLAVLAVATPAPAPIPQSGASGCTTGSAQCCESTQTANSLPISVILSLLGIVLPDLSALIGLGCTPISVIGVGSGNACSTNTVCCDNSAMGGLLGIGCLPISL
ncbi:hydrophobin-251 [Fomes fomentarius]|nr:hydrophobin-251 [Fomes fomentarius]